MSFHFDSTDKKILRYLIRDARIKVVDIASFIGVTSAAIHQRLAKIKNAGVIKEFTLKLDPQAMGYKTCSFVGVYMDKNRLYKDVVDRLQRIEEVVEVHFTTGEYALFLKLYTTDNQHLKHILNEKIQDIPGITRTETFISLEEPISRNIPIK